MHTDRVFKSKWCSTTTTRRTGMKNLIKYVVTLFLVGCGTDNASNPSAPLASPTPTPTPTITNAVKSSSANALLTVVNKGSMALAGNALDGMFFGSFKFFAKSYDRTSKKWNTLNIGTAVPVGLPSTCQTPLLKQGDPVEVSFCGATNELQYAAPNNKFSVDFLVMDIDGIGLVSSNTVYVKADSRIWSPQENNAVKALPIQKVAEATSRLQIVYIRKDWFPKSFTVVYDGMKIDPVVSSSIELNEEERIMIKGLGLGLGTRSMASSSAGYESTINFVPMDLNILDTTGYAANSVDTQQASTVTVKAPTVSKYPACGGEASLPDEVYSGMVPANPKCMINGNACPIDRTINGKLYDWQLMASDAQVCEVTISSVAGLTLADSPVIPIIKAKFVMEIDFSSVLTQDSLLAGDNSMFKFNEVNGIPFGTAISVRKRD